MNIQITIGGIRFRFDSDFEITIEESLFPFLCREKNTVDISIKIVCSQQKAAVPKEEMCGSDLLFEYYRQENRTICLAKGGVTGYLATAICSHDFMEIECLLHFEPQGKMKSLGNLLRMIPMCMILQKHNVMFLHAAQIEIDGKGILFTAPSGKGKTTQSKLWNKYRGAHIVCNDRTLIHEGQTFGYPIDGSEPVISGKTYPLGAIVYLEQDASNRIKPLRPKDCLLKLMPQLIIDTWDSQALVAAMEQIINLISKYPVYQLSCTPDEAAVRCLEQQLTMDGVI